MWLKSRWMPRGKTENLLSYNNVSSGSEFSDFPARSITFIGGLAAPRLPVQGRKKLVNHAGRTLVLTYPELRLNRYSLSPPLLSPTSPLPTPLLKKRSHERNPNLSQSI
jgi:hypothetical protein